jgi:hypothetical protein
MTTFSVEDVIELIRYHVVLSEDSPQAADANLARLVVGIRSMETHCSAQPGESLFCDRCGCTVDTTVLAHDGSNWTPDGDFLCSTCLDPDAEEVHNNPTLSDSQGQRPVRAPL